MILSDRCIRSLIEEGKIGISPFESDQLQPASYDCRLGNHFLEVDTELTKLIRLDHEIKYRPITSESIIIPPQSFLLATTEEYFRLPNDITAFVEGRSSIGRLGLFIQNAGWVDSGFEGRITLELFNANSVPIQLIPGRRICQMVFCQMKQASHSPYRGKYYQQTESVGSRVFMDTDAKQ